MEKAIVTGATGVLGTALVKRLAESKVHTVVVGHRDSGRNHRICQNQYVTLLECDLQEIKKLPEIISGKERFDVFYHLGWVGTTDRNNVDIQGKNIQFTLNAVAAAKKLGCKRFIGAGSQAEYGRHSHEIYPDTLTNPETAYGMAKLCAGQMSRLLASQMGMEHIWARIVSVYGPNDGMNTLVSMMIRKLLNGEKPACTSGEQIWDYLYADDAARALYLLGKANASIVHGHTYVVGSGIGRPLIDFMYMIRDKIDPALPLGIGELNYAEGQVMYLQGNISALTRDIGFVPEISFEEGIGKTIEWIKNGGYIEA